MTQELPNPAEGTLDTTEPLEWLEKPGALSDAALESLTKDELLEVAKNLRGLVTHQESRFACIAEIGRALGSTFNLDELLTVVMGKITELMEAERSTLFLLDKSSNELWSKVTQGVVNSEIRLHVGEGIAGWVAATGKSINIRNAYEDPRFNADFDRKTGFETRSMLCQPIRNQEGQIIGVVQVLNRFDGPFNSEDENLLSALASQAAIALENSKLYLSVVEKNMELTELTDKLEKKISELDLLYDIEKEFSHKVSLEALVQSVTRKTNELFDAQGSVLALREEEHLRFFTHVRRSRGWEFAVRNLPYETGICGKVIEKGRSEVCNQGDCDIVPGAACEELQVTVRNVIAVPLYADNEEIIGALQVLNRARDFDEGDLKLLTVIGSRIAGAVVARRHHEQMEKSERLASIGQMLSGVIHDLKNPIAVINGYVQLMVKSDAREKREKFADTIYKQFDHLDQMTLELLNYARGEKSFMPREILLSDLFEEVEHSLSKELARRDVELVIDLGYDGPAVIDDGKIKRAVINLARNAADAMKGGGTFTISCNIEGDDLLLSFADTGSGIPEDVRASLFDEFVTQGKEHGTGLGLAIVKKIVDQHRGTIRFESTLNEGTTFFIRIPRVTDQELS